MSRTFSFSDDNIDKNTKALASALEIGEDVAKGAILRLRGSKFTMTDLLDAIKKEEVNKILIRLVKDGKLELSVNESGNFIFFRSSKERRKRRNSKHKSS